MKVKRQNFEFYYKLYLQTPATKLLYHFPSQSVMIAKEEFQVRRAMPIVIRHTETGEVIIVESQNEKYIVELTE